MHLPSSHDEAYTAPDGPESLTAAPTRITEKAPHPHFARNLTRSFFEIGHKRCNSNNANSTFEQATGELRATLLGNHPDQRGGRIHRQAAPVTSRCTRYVTLHPIRTGALPTDRVHCLRIGCTAQRWNTPQKTLPPPHVSPTDRNSRSHKSPEPYPQQRDTGSHATPHNPRAEPANPTPDATRPRPVSRPRPRRAHSAALSEAPPIRRSCPRDPRPRRGQPRGERRGRGTASRTRSPGPRHGRSGSTAGRHRARRTRRA